MLSETQSPAISDAYAVMLDRPLETPLASADGCSTTSLFGYDSSLAVGTVTITGTTSPVTLERPGVKGLYRPNAAVPTDLFTDGAQLMVHATGATVPEFTGTVTAPTPLANVVFPTALSRSAPATITWTQGSGTTMWFLLLSEEATMLCKGPDNGSFTLTTGALALLPASTTSARIYANRVVETTTTAGAWTIYIRAADAVSGTEIPLGS